MKPLPASHPPQPPDASNGDDCCPPYVAGEVVGRPLANAAADAELAVFAKAIGHPVRVRILRMLAEREARMCSLIVDELPLAQSTVSEHLRILKAAGLGEVPGRRTARQLLH